MMSTTFPLVVVSNRLPVSFSVEEHGSRVPILSPGGLVAAVAPALEGKNAAWVGWDGTDSSDEMPLQAEGITLFPVSIGAMLVERHYEGYSNSTLWPLFHDVGVEPAYDPSWWQAYQEVNAIHAQKAASIISPGGIVWVHDYQMMLVPGLLRKLRPDVTIGYFHHIPLCGLERITLLPEHGELLAGIAGADVAGFQRDQDTRNFVAARAAFTSDSSRTRAHTYPISVDFGAVSRAASDPVVVERAAELRREWGNPHTVFLGVDRIDYTKGIPERLEAWESLLLQEDLSCEDSVLVQTGSPSRENVSSYQELRQRIESVVARINETFTSSTGRPAVVYSAHNLERAEMLAHFVAADVMIVSSLRDGMNLVAKEYVACKNDDSGVLVLSAHTGAADTMVDALIVDPTKPAELEQALLSAAAMDPAEQRTRMMALRAEVRTHDVGWWADRILEDLASASEKP